MGVTPPYFLYVGADEQRKGVDTLIEAFASAKSQGLNQSLVLAGSNFSSQQPLPDGVKTLGYVEETQLSTLLAAADAVVAPSLDEGFGLLPLEAAAHGTPSIVSDIPVFRETLGSIAVFVPPSRPDLFATELLNFKPDTNGSPPLAELASKYSWKLAADSTYRVFEQVATT